MKRCIWSLILCLCAVPAHAAQRVAEWTYQVADFPQVEWFELRLDDGIPINLGLPLPTTSTDLDLTYDVAFADDGLASGTHVAYVTACNTTGGCSDPNAAQASFTVNAPVDCVVSDWSCTDWSACDASGTQARDCTRTVLTPPADGGMDCPTDLTKTETQTCTLPLPVPSDTTAPTVSIAVRHNGNSKNFGVVASATDDVGVVRVTLSLDGRGEAPMGLTASDTWSATVGVSFGAHTITVFAYDAAGNVGSTSKTFTR